jgi:hypothetical protein
MRLPRDLLGSDLLYLYFHNTASDGGMATEAFTIAGVKYEWQVDCRCTALLVGEGAAANRKIPMAIRLQRMMAKPELAALQAEATSLRFLANSVTPSIFRDSLALRQDVKGCVIKRACFQKDSPRRRLSGDGT